MGKNRRYGVDYICMMMQTACTMCICVFAPWLFTYFLLHLSVCWTKSDHFIFNQILILKIHSCSIIASNRISIDKNITGIILFTTLLVFFCMVWCGTKLFINFYIYGQRYHHVHVKPPTWQIFKKQTSLAKIRR